MDIKDVLRYRYCVVLLLAMVSTCVMAQAQYFHCEYLDAVEANWHTGLIERNTSGSRQYIGKKFTVNRQTGEIIGIGDKVAMLLFPPFLPEVAKADQETDNYQLIWRNKYTTGYQQVTFFNVREGQSSGKGPYQFTHITTTDWFLSGLCYPSFKP